MKQMYANCDFLRLPFRWQLAVYVIWQNRGDNLFSKMILHTESKRRAGICMYVPK